MAAIIRGMEIGLAPMQALSSIAVINGRASLWGDALPALMQRAGHELDSGVEGDGDKMVAWATLKRGDTGQIIRRTFSASDAKAAGLWGKQGPWQQYKSRMLQLRARGLCCRDGAADTLMGLQVAEEMRDTPKPRDVTPQESGWAKMAKQARGEVMLDETHSMDEEQQEQEAVRQDQAPIEDAKFEDGEAPTEDGEVGHWTIRIDTSWGVPDSDEWTAGHEAFLQDAPLTDNPHQDNEQAAQSWARGWTDTSEEAG